MKSQASAHIATLGLCTMLILTSGCAHRTASAPPTWIDGVGSGYPTAQYLTGVGQADSAQVAAERAYAAVARIFKAEITAQSRDWESFLVLEAKGSQNTERRVTLDQVTRVSTDKVLENVKLLETWVDPKQGQHYAMAGMNRAQAEQALLERIMQLDQTLEVQLRDARQSPEPLTRIRNLHRAIKSLILREAYNTDLRIVRVDGRGSQASYQVAALASELEQFLAANLLIGVEVTGEQAEAVRRAIMDGLLREGLPVTAGTTETTRAPELLVKGTAHFWDTDVPDKQFRYVRWCSDFLIVERGTNRAVGAVSKSGREGHLTANEARTKAVRMMQQELTADLAKTVASYIYGDLEAPAALPPSACPRKDKGTIGGRPNGSKQESTAG